MAAVFYLPHLHFHPPPAFHDLGTIAQELCSLPEHLLLPSSPPEGPQTATSDITSQSPQKLGNESRHGGLTISGTEGGEWR